MPRNFRNLSDLSSTLNKSQDKKVLRYSHSIGKFELVEFNTTLDLSAANINKEFITQLEKEIDVEGQDITNFNYDAGSF
jgi:hypothetical protein